jgi:hypothetical protein
VNLKYEVKSAETPFIMQLAGVNKMEIDVCSNQYHHTECDVTIKNSLSVPSSWASRYEEFFIPTCP